MPSSVSSAGSGTAPPPVEKPTWRQGAVHSTRVMNAGFVQVYPQHVTFKDVEVDTLYMLRLNIKNNHNQSHRVKIVPPETNDFRLLFVPNRPLAPGLEMTAEIEFRAREGRDYHDRIIIESDEDSIEVRQLPSAPLSQSPGASGRATLGQPAEPRGRRRCRCTPLCRGRSSSWTALSTSAWWRSAPPTLSRCS